MLKSNLSSLNRFTEDTIDSAVKEAEKNQKGIIDHVKTGTTIMGKASASASGQVINSRSIINAANKSVLQFPIYVCDSIPVVAAQIIGKLFERVYASFVQTAMSQYPYIDNVDDIKNMEFLKAYHTNIPDIETRSLKDAAKKFVTEYYEPIDDLDAILVESLNNEIRTEADNIITFTYMPESNVDIAMESARMANDPLTGFRYLTEAEKDEDKVKVPVSRKSSSEETMKDDKISKEHARKLLNKTSYDDVRAELIKGPKSLPNGDTIRMVSGKDGEPEYILSYKSTKRSSSSEPMKALDAPKLLKDADAKKFNGMLPWTMEVQFMVWQKNKEGKREGRAMPMTFIIGVKSIMHIFNVKDLGDDLQDLITGKQKNLRQIKYKTGEITSLKEYLFDIKGIKRDASKTLGSKRWLNTLKRLGDYSDMNGSVLKKPVEALSGGHVPIPNGTLIIDHHNVEYLKEATGIDLENIDNARTLAKRLFLIAVVILHNSADSMKVFFPDSANDWDIQSISSIEADVGKAENSFLTKELNKITFK